MLISLYSTNVGLAALSLLVDLVAGEACVTGGPAARVDVAQRCCSVIRGDWFQNFENQGIYVFAEANLTQYNECFDKRWTVDVYVPTCIECDETVVNNPSLRFMHSYHIILRNSSWDSPFYALQYANIRSTELWTDA